MANGGDLDSVLVFGVEEHTLVATAEPETSGRRLELFHIAGTGGQAAIHAVKNLHGRFAVDGAQIGAGFPN